MRLKIEFQDKNHNVISIHYIEYKTITPPYFKAFLYYNKIAETYPEVCFCNVSVEK
jgi:hypothetical protein